MDFTREPVVETVVTPKDGHKLVIRNSKGVGHEEFFVDSVEVVSFGGCYFFRSLERPKSFMVPVTDYEVLEVRETRVVLKHAAVDVGSIKIGGDKNGGKTTQNKESKETTEPALEGENKTEVTQQVDKKRDRRRTRRRREREKAASAKEEPKKEESAELEVEIPQTPVEEPEQEVAEAATEVSKTLASEVDIDKATEAMLLPPPQRLISETISKYKEFDFFSHDPEGPLKQEEAIGALESLLVEDTVVEKQDDKGTKTKNILPPPPPPILEEPTAIKEEQEEIKETEGDLPQEVKPFVEEELYLFSTPVLPSEEESAEKGDFKEEEPPVEQEQPSVEVEESSAEQEQLSVEVEESSAEQEQLSVEVEESSAEQEQSSVEEEEPSKPEKKRTPRKGRRKQTKDEN